MPTKAPSHSTRLENFRFADGRALLEIDGNAVEFAGAKAEPAIQAFQSFYHEAQRAYTAAPPQPKPSASTPASWWQRLRSWLVKWLAPGDGASNPASAPPFLDTPAAAATATPQAETQAPSPSPQAEPAKRSPKTAPKAVAPLVATKPTEPTADPKPAPASKPKADPKNLAASGTINPAKGRAETEAAPAADAKASVASAPVSRSDPPEKRESDLLLSAVFADEKGVHLIWDAPGAKGPAKPTERIYALNSPVADRLQACYCQLSELGYDIVDLEVWRKTPDAENSPSPSPSPGPAPAPAPAPAPVPVPAAPAKSNLRTRSVSADAPKVELPFVAELRPKNIENPARLVVSAIDGDRRSHPIRVADMMAHALHSAADPARPSEERLTFLRCAKIGDSHRIMEVGFGKQPDGRPEPENWQPVDAWWDSLRKAPEAATPDRTQPAPQTTAAQPELFH